jgi:hypothetical protein
MDVNAQVKRGANGTRHSSVIILDRLLRDAVIEM